jgi:hypothetical protein
MTMIEWPNDERLARTMRDDWKEAARAFVEQKRDEGCDYWATYRLLCEAYPNIQYLVDYEELVSDM